MQTILRLKPDHNRTLEELMHINASLGGKNYIDLDDGTIVQLVEKKVTVVEAPKKKK